MCVVQAGDESKRSIYLKYDLFQNTLDSLARVCGSNLPSLFFIFNCCTMQCLLDFKNVLVGMSSTV